MGREFRRKEKKRNGQRDFVYDNGSVDSTVKASTLLKIILVVLVILFGLYYAVAVFITKEIDVSGSKEEATSSSDTSSVSNKILASRVFEQSEDEYYVYFYDFSDEDDSVASAIGNVSDFKIYRVDTSSSLNSNYVSSDTGNSSATGLSDLKVINPTLIKVSGDGISLYLEGASSIISYFG